MTTPVYDALGIVLDAARYVVARGGNTEEVSNAIDILETWRNQFDVSD